MPTLVVELATVVVSAGVAVALARLALAGLLRAAFGVERS